MKLARSRHTNYATKEVYDLYRQTDSPLAYEEEVEVELSETTEYGFSEKQLLEWDNRRDFIRPVR